MFTCSREKNKMFGKGGIRILEAQQRVMRWKVWKDHRIKKVNGLVGGVSTTGGLHQGKRWFKTKK